MSKKSRGNRQQVASVPRQEFIPTGQAGGGIESFSFGDPTPVLDGREILDYIECWANGRWYEPPLSLDGLAKSVRASVHLQSGIQFKRNQLEKMFIPHRLLSRQAFGQLAMDWLSFGNAYLEKRDNMLRQAIGLQPSLAKYMRRGVDLDSYFMVRGWRQEHEFARGTVCQLRETDINQEIYGLPEWLSALQSALLNESATLFRRKYYQNGSHAGFILYITDNAHNEDDINNLRTALKNSKGPGNFKNMLVYAPGGKKDGMQLIPVSEVSAKDEFNNIKNISRDDLLAAQRIPLQCLAVVPQNAGGFGSAKEATEVWMANELEPLQYRFEPINEWLGEEVIRFKEFVPTASS
ncbi:phage portal protein [Pseudomonas kuykendallii]|uniref:Phage portal protein, PBSX family n=1 Tax=Pseudomonas kuykendallii TaxID=1007099 RepID=A0A1H3DHQ0_9PSED|nr:phage portal protein [Pseudomonas kuykendallii]MCQ4270274.1 phage portal protein [Pseudomonas kuykendallii]SDX65983.1 phage portal protein, PBSX family [Pseudomonas kuykendallii]